MPKDQIRIVELDEKQAMVGFQEFHGKEQFVLRFMYEDSSDGELKPGRNGINMPAEVAMDAISEMIVSYNEHHGTEWTLVDMADNSDD